MEQVYQHNPYPTSNQVTDLSSLCQHTPTKFDMPASDVDRNLKLFLGSRVQVLISTIAAAAGVDRPDVSRVFIHGIIAGIITTIQMAARAGRDNRGGAAILTYTKFEYDRAVGNAAGNQNGGEPDPNYGTLLQTIDTTDCRLHHLSSYFDNNPTSCHEINGPLCDNCQATFTPLPPPTGSRIPIGPVAFAPLLPPLPPSIAVPDGPSALTTAKVKYARVKEAAKTARSRLPAFPPIPDRFTNQTPYWSLVMELAKSSWHRDDRCRGPGCNVCHLPFPICLRATAPSDIPGISFPAPSPLLLPCQQGHLVPRLLTQLFIQPEDEFQRILTAASVNLPPRTAKAAAALSLTNEVFFAFTHPCAGHRTNLHTQVFMPLKASALTLTRLDTRWQDYTTSPNHLQTLAVGLLALPTFAHFYSTLPPLP